MAIAFRSIASATFAGSPVVINVPAGVVNGDLLIMTVSDYSSGAVAQTTTPSGWTFIRYAAASNNSLSQTTFWRIASSEPASYSVATGGSPLSTFGAIAAYTGVQSGTPIRTSGAVTAVTGTTSPTPATLAGMLTGDLGIIVYTASWSVTQMTPPASGWTTRVQLSEGNSNAEFAYVDKLNGTDTPTASSPNGTWWAVQSIALSTPSTSTGFLPFFIGP